MAEIIIGLDLGVSSIGGCVRIGNKIDKIMVNIFPEGVKKNAQGKESSLNATRTEKRQIRRQLFRKNQRRKMLVELLQAIGWFPTNEEKLNEIMALNPYELRAKGLKEDLTPNEFARVLFHLAKRRGFKSSRKSGGKEEGTLFEGDKKADKKGINELYEAMQEADYETVGEYLASINPHEVRIRNRYLLRKDLIEEYDKLWEAQLRFHPDWKRPKNYEEVVKKFFNLKYHPSIFSIDFPTFLKEYVIYFQRKLKSQKGKVANCKFEPKSKRAPASCFIFQEFRILQKLHDIRVVGHGRNDTPLTKKEIDAAFEWLNVARDKTVEQLKKHLGLSAFDFNFDDKTKIKGNRTANDLIGILGKDVWKSLSQKEKFDRWRVLYDAEDDDWLIKYAREKWQLNDEQVQKVLKFSPESGYAELSQKAMNKLVPLMLNENLDYTNACQRVGYHHSLHQTDKHFADTLGTPPNLRNPIVQQGLFELRKLVNAIIEAYGTKPDKIRIEFARELKMPKTKRENLKFENTRREKEHAEIEQILRDEFQILSPQKNDILKYKLWIEAEQQCVYTGEYISKKMLFGPNVEIEHIEPYSRSLNDSQSNKTLAIKRFNDLKGNDLPYEMMVKGKITETQYHEIIERAKRFVKKGSYAKFKRFVKHTIAQDMISRQLNDTAWLAVEARKFLLTICPKVEVIAGVATADLRQLWGLNSILNKYGLNIKTREDHRHHAIDAVVVACTDVGMIQELSRRHEKGKKADHHRFPAPWEGFRNEVKDAVNGILVKHKQRNRVRGQLHDETIYGEVKSLDGRQRKDGKAQLYFKNRIDIRDLVNAPAKVDKIGDEKIKELVKQRIREFGANPDDKKFKIPANTFAEPLFLTTKKGDKIPIKRISIHDVAKSKIQVRPGAYVDSGNNHHIVIYAKPDGKKEGIVVSFFEVAQRKLRQKPIYNTNVGQGNTFLMTLEENELVLLDNDTFLTSEIDWNTVMFDELSPNLYRVQKLTDGTITFRHHLTSVLKNSEGDEVGRVFKTPNTFEGIKVKVNELGEIKPI